jgi:hypothetical protein
MVDAVFEVVEGERIVLRRFRVEDLPEFCAYRANPGVARYQSWDNSTAADGGDFSKSNAGCIQAGPEPGFRWRSRKNRTSD